MIYLKMTNTIELFSRQDYETRYAELIQEKQKALQKVVTAKRNELFETLRAIVTAEESTVSDADTEAHRSSRPNPPSPDLEPVLRFEMELERIEVLVSETRKRFWPYEGNWKQVAESFHAAIPDTDTRNATLAAISDTFNPQIHENDKRRLRSIMQTIGNGIQEIELTATEQERLFLPLSGIVRGKFNYVSSFSIEQLLQRKLLAPASEQSQDGSRTFRLESPAGIREVKVQLTRMDSAYEDVSAYEVTASAKRENERGLYFHIYVPKDLEPLWQSLFDRETQDLIRMPVSSSPYNHPLSRMREGVTMKMPVVMRQGLSVPVMQKDAQMFAPESALLEGEWLRAHMYTQEEIERR